MADFGIGLGAFVQGFGKGMEMRNSYEDRKTRNEQAKEDRAYTKERRARQQVLDGRSDEEYNRNETQRKNIQQIGLGVISDFNKAVSEGKANPADFETFWSKNAVPMLTQQYHAAGDTDGAKKMQDWAETSDAKRGGKLALQAMYLSQNGDYAGALQAAQEAGKIQGYIKHAYQFTGQTEIHDNKGRLQGYSLTVKDADGKEHREDIPLSKMAQVIAAAISPKAASDSQLAAIADNAKDKRELKQYKDKKLIDQQYGSGDQKLRSDSINSLRKTMDGGLKGDEPKLDDLSEEDREAAILKEMQLRKGPGLAMQGAPMTGSATQPTTPSSPTTPSATPRKALMDTATGQRVPLKPVASQQAAPAPAPMSPEQRMQSVLQDSANALSEGENPERIKQNLLNNGVPEQEWPAALRAKLEQNQSGVFGLGR